MSVYFAAFHVDPGLMPPLWLNAASFIAAMIYPLKLYLMEGMQRERVQPGVR